MRHVRQSIVVVVCLLTTLACNASAQSVDSSLSELDLVELPEGVANNFDTQPEYGALPLLESANDAVWLLFDEEETCLLIVARSFTSDSSIPITELGPDDLSGGIGCNSPTMLRERGTVSANQNSQRSLISMVLPISHWNKDWELKDEETLKPYKVVGISPYSVHLYATNTALLDALETEGRDIDDKLNISISCTCGNLYREARFSHEMQITPFAPNGDS